MAFLPAKLLCIILRQWISQDVASWMCMCACPLRSSLNSYNSLRTITQYLVVCMHAWYVKQRKAPPRHRARRPWGRLRCD
ncbi:hypothetical protein B0I35DRAFT_425615 [Stachybotrys elegans]|uniref:Secreted protein n=1 Tax=Stachybotrys elegans TaxID=80388 RepID=A0A8K0SYF2_9HYPO|nr:hypothetical protein B0I35DRAFT_425615 [Stachybotrys elegans]